MTISHACRTHTPTLPPQVTTPRLCEEEQESGNNVGNMQSLTRVGIVRLVLVGITLESGTLDTTIPAKVGKYGTTGEVPRQEASDTRNTLSD